MLDSFLQDVRLSWRGLTKTPIVSAVAVATLALGIGANTAIFSVVHAIVVRPLPYRDADRLVRLTADFTTVGASDVGLSLPELTDFRDSAGLFQTISGLWPLNANLTGVDQPERVEVLLTSPSYFDMLGAVPQLGQLFGPADNGPGITQVVVISDALWRRRFGGRRDAIGRKLRLDDDTYEVIGVVSAGFRHPGRSVFTAVDIWAPASFAGKPFPDRPPRGARFITDAIASLRPGVSIDEARQRAAALAERLRREYPDDYPARAGWTPRIVPLKQDLVGSVRPALLLLFGAVGLVLLIACANIANLLMARTSRRQLELAMRSALGASRGRLARLLLTESLMLAAFGGAAAAIVGPWMLTLLVAMAPPELPRLGEVHISGAVLLFNAIVALGSAVLVGSIPALQFSRAGALDALRGRSRGETSRRGGARAALVIGEFSLAVVLLLGAALLARSFWRLQRVDLGFDPHSVLTARLWLPQPNDPSTGRYFEHSARLARFDDIMARVAALPGVSGVAAASALPFDGNNAIATMTVEGSEMQPGSRVPAVRLLIASPRYFEVMSIRVLRGRTFSNDDDADGAPVAIVTAATARQYWPGQDPVGRRFHFGGPNARAPWLTVIGVVDDARAERPEVPPSPTVYRSLRQVSGLSLSLVLETAADPAALAPAVARAVRASDPELPVFGVRSMKGIIEAATASRRFSTQLIGAFALLALLLAALGIYGVMSFAVAQRTREMGLRIALGARPGRMVASVLAQALLLAGIGIAAGLLAAVVFARLLSGLLFEIGPMDPPSYAAIVLILGVTAAAAAWRPAARAARVDPMVALRAD
ncbi:MAG TPA: ABC transporter permease [Vicinamibacterales bacterium]|nr:ABC transporter permease [Vicinamibacterales bacterium]